MGVHGPYGGTISYIGEPLNYYRFHDASVTEKVKGTGVGIRGSPSSRLDSPESFR